MDWKEKTLIQLGYEKPFNGNINECTGLVRRCTMLHDSSLQSLEVEDIRILVSQNLGFPFTLRLALEILDADLYVEAEYYPGDLLVTVLSTSKNSQTKYPEENLVLQRLIQKRDFKLEFDLFVDTEISQAVDEYLS